MSTSVGTLKLVRSYPSKTDAQPVFVYEVTCSRQGAIAYETAQGENFRRSDETGKPLFFAKRAVPNGSQLEISNNGSVYANTTNLAAAASMVGTLGGNNPVLQQALANAFADKVMGGMLSGNASFAGTSNSEPEIIQDAGPQDQDLSGNETEEERIEREATEAKAAATPVTETP